MGLQRGLEQDVAGLLACPDPSVRYWARVDLCAESPGSADVQAVKREIGASPRVRQLMAAPDEPLHPYQKWRGAHWRLVSLVELGAGLDDPRLVDGLHAAVESVLTWLTGPRHREGIKVIGGLTRRCASQEGNALAVCSRLGLVDDPRVRLLAESLRDWQWPDGGWNCDKNPAAHHSSFYESLVPLWGMVEYVKASGQRAYLDVVARAAEFFLRHRLFRSERTGDVIDPAWLDLHYPVYWHYDVLQALLVLSRCGPLTDPRLNGALDRVEDKRDGAGWWAPDGRYWRTPGSKGSQVEVVDWGRRGPNPMLTLNALRVLKAAGRMCASAPR